MGYGFKHGGASSLNYHVVGGVSAPENPRENTIWVNTDAAITDHIFSPDEPEKVEGLVWFATGASSTVPFNALKKSGIIVRPVSCKQVLSGEWADKEAKTYQNGWKSWIFYLIEAGVIKQAFHTYGVANVTVSVNENDDSVTIDFKTNVSGYGEQGMWYTEIDLTGVSAVTMTVRREDYSYFAKPSMLAVWSSLPAYTEQNIVAQAAIGEGTVTVSADVSALSGVHLVGIHCETAGGTTYTVTDLHCR